SWPGGRDPRSPARSSAGRAPTAESASGRARARSRRTAGRWRTSSFAVDLPAAQGQADAAGADDDLFDLEVALVGIGVGAVQHQPRRQPGGRQTEAVVLTRGIEEGGEDRDSAIPIAAGAAQHQAVLVRIVPRVVGDLLAV